MLSAYLLRVQQLVINPPDTNSLLYSSSDLTKYINTARGQLASEGVIQVSATLAVTNASQVYPFASIVVTGTSGVAAVLNVRQMQYQVSGGAVNVAPRPWPWFRYYNLGKVAVPGPPTEWAQYGQGEQGSLYVTALDTNYTLAIDTVCLPINLVDDTTPEAIPYPWTDAVPYYAAYLAYTSDQRRADADEMFKEYQMFVDRARKFSTPSVLPGTYQQQSTDPTKANRLGLAQGSGGG